MDKSKLLDQCGALGEDRTLLARVLDRAKQASERNIPAATDFLSPAQQAQAADLLHAAGIPETAYIHWGGYDGAERAVLLFLPDWMDPSDAGTYSPIRCLRAAFRKEENLTHRDFLWNYPRVLVIFWFTFAMAIAGVKVCTEEAK